MIKLQSILIILLATSWQVSPVNAAPEITPFGSSLLRYENETQFVNKPDRERIRVILNAGVKLKFNDNCTLVGRVSTGVKNKQNIPTLTIKRLTTQPQPDSDVYFDQVYLKYKNKDWQFALNRVPWKFAANTDTFWDRHLNPYTVFSQYNVSENQSISAAYIKLLDGSNQSVGNMFVGQYQLRGKVGETSWEFAPWIVDYSEQNQAQFAVRDTQFDHRSVRVAIAAKYGLWKLDIDYGYAFDIDQAIEQSGLDSNQNTSGVFQLNYGNLKSEGYWQWHIRYMHVERISVITEFAQNAIAAALTSNFKGWDSRLRYSVSPSIWVGTRLSKVSSFVGDFKNSHRFRIEARLEV